MKTLKVEPVYQMAFAAFDDVVEYLPRLIADIYNGRRLHSALDDLSPKQFEDQLPPAKDQISSLILSGARGPLHSPFGPMKGAGP